MTGACTRRGGKVGDKAGEGRGGWSRKGGEAKESKEGQSRAGHEVGVSNGVGQEGEKIRSESKMRCVGC